MFGWTFAEVCSGSAAISLHLLGARRTIVPYQGGKWSLRNEIESVVRRLGFFGEPSRIVLSDATHWAQTIATILEDRDRVARLLEPIVVEGEADPRAVYDRLVASPMPSDPYQRAAVALWLQRMSFAAKAVGNRQDKWLAHGLNNTSAYGYEGGENFNEIDPLGPSLLRAVQSAPRMRSVSVVSDAALVVPEGRTCAFFDPPYRGTTGYSGGKLSRDEVVDIARKLVRGAAVIISEAEAIDELVDDGWRCQLIRGSDRTDQRQKFRKSSSAQEWVTFSPMRS